MRSRIEPMKKVATTLRTHRELILNYFRAKKQFSSGIVEGLNNKAKLTMRKAYGLRTFRVTEIALHSENYRSQLSPIDSTDDCSATIWMRILTRQMRRRRSVANHHCVGIRASQRFYDPYFDCRSVARWG
jgi:hypothetical protein